MNYSLIPTALTMPFGVDAGVGIMAFGRMPEKAPNGWKLGSNGQKNEFVEKQIAECAFNCEINTILAPVSDFSGSVCDPEQLSHHSDYQVGRCEKVVIKRNAHADGVVVPPGTAYYLASADCLTLLLYDPVSRRLVCGHAGRESLYDKAKLEGMPARTHESLTQSMVAVIGGRPEHLRAFAGFGIGRQHFLHPTDGDTAKGQWNQRMRLVFSKWDPALSSDKTGRLSLRTVIKNQLVEQGVLEDRIELDSTDTFSDQRADHSGFQWWSNRRGDTLERNGVLVVYNTDLMDKVLIM